MSKLLKIGVEVLDRARAQAEEELARAKEYEATLAPRRAEAIQEYERLVTKFNSAKERHRESLEAVVKTGQGYVQELGELRLAQRKLQSLDATPESVLPGTLSMSVEDRKLLGDARETLTSAI